MANFTGTASKDVITPGEVSAGVTRDPANSRPSFQADNASGGLGNDTISLSAGNDILNGDDGADLLDGGADNDGLNGGAGADTLIGGSGNDGLTGGEGSDVYRFGRNWGQDTVNAQAATGRDVIQFLDNVNRDRVEFRVENDDLIITQGANSIFISNQYQVGSTPGVREVDFATGPSINVSRPDAAWLDRSGSALNDQMTGSIFRDTLDGRGGNDNIFGGDGNDVLTGGRGNDGVSGGLGNDTYRFESGFGVDSLSETFNGGKDTIQFLSGLGASDFDITVQGSSLVIERGANRVTLQNQYSSGTGRNALFETIDFARGADVDIRKVDDDWISRTGRNIAERFDGSIFKDTIDGSGGNDTISGVDGNDVLTGGRGDDLLSGGAGNDVYRFESRHGVDTVSESFNGGRDTIEFLGAIRAGDLDFRIDGTTLTVIDGGSRIVISGQYQSGVGANALVERIEFGNDSTLSLTRPDSEWLKLQGTRLDEFFSGSVFGDTISGSSGADNINGGSAGRDELNGDSGNDTLSGGAENDTLSGGSGLDSIFGGEGNDVIDGGNDADSIRGEGGNDDIKGGAGADTIDAGDGRNVIDGGTGGDLLTGGIGADNFFFKRGDGVDVITNFQTGRDTLQFEGFGASFNSAQELLRAADQNGDDVVFDLTVGGVRAIKLTLVGVDLDDLSADNFLF